MAEGIPGISTSQPGRDSNVQSETLKTALNTTKTSLLGRAKSPERIDGTQSAARPLSTGKGYSSKFIPSFGNQVTQRASIGDGRKDGQAIDPLSHAIIQRTTTSNIPSNKMPAATAAEDNAQLENIPTATSGRPSIEPQPTRTDTSNTTASSKDKRNRVSFFSRFAKKKDGADPPDNESEHGEKRTEGMDSAVFSQPIGYVPQFPSPPKYIKVRSHGKKEKDFNRLFLAQELKGRTGLEIAQNGGRPLKNGVPKTEPRKDDNAIWAMEFSKDGKLLAAGGGRHHVVRVWSVLTNKDDRRAHEAEEDVVALEGQNERLNAPVFRKKTVQEYSGHTASILDLSWSKNNFLLSSSMDKTVRLWHASREECLCCFKHSDFVTSIQFHPRDDRFFLAGSLDSKLRLWSIPDKSVAYWNSLPDLITAVAFSPDGKTAMAGCLNGLCIFYDTEGLKYQTQMHVRSAHGKNAKGSKVTGIQAINYPPDDQHGDVKILVTSNDSRVRVYNLRDKGLELKLKGNENSCSQIHATFSEDAKYIICGSEDKRAYIWSASPPDSEKDKHPVEIFEAHHSIVTKAILAPTNTRQLLSASADPIYDLCNPPPITLVSRTQSHSSLQPPTEEAASSAPHTVPPEVLKSSKPEESPSYLSRCSHPTGHIIVTADFHGNIKVFRHDCAFTNRVRNNDSAFTKKMAGRTNSVATKNSTRSSRASLQLGSPSTDRILSWRQSINNTTSSFDSFRHNSTTSNKARSISPRKSLGQASLPTSARHPYPPRPSFAHGTPSPSQHPSFDSRESGPAPSGTDSPSKGLAGFPKVDKESDPLMLRGDQSYMFYNPEVYQAQADNAHLHLDGKHDYASTVGSSNASLSSPRHDPTHLGAPVRRELTAVSRLSSENTSEVDVNPGKDGEVTCQKCGGTSFKVRLEGAGKQTLVCERCGTALV